MGTVSITVNPFILGISLCDVLRIPDAWLFTEKDYTSPCLEEAEIKRYLSADEQRCPRREQFYNSS